MIGSRFTRIVATGALATAFAGGIVSSSQAIPLPVTSAKEIVGAAPVDHVQWWGWGWRRPGIGGALAAGAIAGGVLGLAAAASTSSYYGYGYPYYGYSYPYYSYSYPASYYSYPSYYGGYSYPYYGWGYRGYWLSGKRVMKQKRRSR